MDRKLQAFFESAKSISLTPYEREDIRAVLGVAQKLGTFGLEESEKMFIRQQLVSKIHRVPTSSKWYGMFTSFLRLTAVMGAAVLTLAFGKQLAQAIESSLPGQLLYPVKLHVVESVISSLNFTPEAEAAWAVTQVKRRLNEASAFAISDDEYVSILTRYTNDANEYVSRTSAAAAEALRKELDVVLQAEERRLERQTQLRPSRRMLETVHALRTEKLQERGFAPERNGIQE